MGKYALFDFQFLYCIKHVYGCCPEVTITPTFYEAPFSHNLQLKFQWFGDKESTRSLFLSAHKDRPPEYKEKLIAYLPSYLFLPTLSISLLLSYFCWSKRACEIWDMTDAQHERIGVFLVLSRPVLKFWRREGSFKLFIAELWKLQPHIVRKRCSVEIWCNDNIWSASIDGFDKIKQLKI